MQPPLNARLRHFATSPTVAVAALAERLAAEGRTVYDLSTGEPDFATEAFVCEAGKRAIDDGETKYTASDGSADLKRAVATKLARDGHPHYPPEQIAVGSGAKPLLANILMALLNPGDEVLIPTPCWPSHPGMALALGAEPVFVPASQDDDYCISPAQLRAALTPRTRVLLFCNPCNPTGALYSAEQQRALAEVLAAYPNVWVVTDEIYADIVFDGRTHTPFVVAAPELATRTTTLQGLSKGYAMTGWRIGFAAGPAPVMRATRQIMSQLAGSPGGMNQRAAIAALEGDQSGIATRNTRYQARREQVIARLAGVSMLRTFSPKGAFYVFVDCSAALGRTTPAGQRLETSSDFTTYLLERGGVAVVPGDAFEAPGTFRLSIANSDEVLSAACDAIAEACGALA